MERNIKSNLIFDLGFNTLSYNNKKYLQNGYKIIAVEADPNLCSKVNLEIDGLTLLNKCIWSETDKTIPFYLSKTWDVWNSIFKNISERIEDNSTEIQVETITLADLIKEYGTPIYCKIDIEGADEIALESLKTITERPKFISTETECLGKDDKMTFREYDGLKILSLLKDLGYTKFYLHFEDFNKKGYSNFYLDPEKDYSDWKSYDEICEELVSLRKNHQFNFWYDFWYDVYATY